ncbi:MAG: hypothetical protein NC218_09605 [Acetobacter sp.]|nr:hypothetical protein [Acetobacter sp.]
MAQFRVKYGYTTNEENIAKGLAKGSIDAGDIIIVNKDGVGTLRFVLQDGSTVIPISADVDAEQLKTAVDSAIDTTIDEKIETAVDNKLAEANDGSAWEDFT